MKKSHFNKKNVLNLFNLENIKNPYQTSENEVYDTEDDTTSSLDTS